MPQPFLITGLPRSRTAWMAAVCNTQANTICHHEPARQAGGWRESLALWCGASRYGHVGISDSALGFHLAEIIAQFKPNVLVVQRDIGAVEASLSRIGVVSPGYCHVLQRRIVKSLRHPLVTNVAFFELSDPDVVMECLRWLLPGALLDRDKIEIMCRMNVQADQAMLQADLNQKPIDPSRVLGADVIQEIRSCLGVR